MIRPLFASLLICAPLMVLAADPAPAPDPKAEAVLKDFAKYYTEAKTFQAKLTSTLNMDVKGMKNQMESVYDLAVQRPNLLAFRLSSGMMGGVILSDGATKIVYVPMLKKYTSEKAPENLNEIFAPFVQGLITQSLPFGFEPLLTTDIAADLREGTTKITYEGSVDLNGVKAHQVKILKAVFTMDLWIAEGEQPLLLKAEVALNISALPEEHLKQFEIKDMRRITVYSDWKINESIAPETFQFQPPADAQKVDSFVPGGAGAAREASPLIGKTAPDFSLKDLEGAEVKLSALRGKIVVIDFWATWCPPCVRSLPVLAEVTKSFQDQGVVFYAINAREDVTKIREFLKSKDLSIPVLLDADGGVMTLYGVQSIPQSVVIDKEGIIRSVHVGFSPDLKTKLSSELETLVKGGQLPAPDKEKAP